MVLPNRWHQVSSKNTEKKGFMGQRKQVAQSIYGAEPQTMNALGHAIVRLINDYKSERYSTQGMYLLPNPVKCVGLAWDITHSTDVSHTHSSPEGHKTCWGGCKPKHEPYSGWYGRVWVRYGAESGSSDAFAGTLTHTGSGGGGWYDGPWDDVAKTHFTRFGRGKLPFDVPPEPKLCSWDYSIFDLDWPQIIEVKEHNELACLRKFEGLDVPKLSNNFLWEDPETKAKDEAFLLDCRRVTHQKEVLKLLR
jgi:hypothetical protein